MNLLGKVLIVAILVMSVVFMGFSMAVYATHQNWKTEADTLQSQLSQAQNDLRNKEDEYQRLEARLTQEVESAQQQVRKLAFERERLVATNSDIRQQIDSLHQDQRTSIAAVASTQDLNTKLTGEIENLRTDLKENQDARDAAFSATVAASEEAHQVRNQLESTAQRNLQLTQMVAGMTSVMRENGLDPNMRLEDVKPKVDGFVSYIRRQGSTQLVQVNIGSDDGLRPGHTVEVFRDGKYLGRVEILKTNPDNSVGRVDPRFQQGPIQEGDRVATRLNLS